MIKNAFLSAVFAVFASIILMKAGALSAQPKVMPNIPPPSVTGQCRAEVAKADAIAENDNETSYLEAAEIYKKAVGAQYDCIPALTGYTHAISMARGRSLSFDEYRLAYQYITRAMVLDANNAKAYWILANLLRNTNRAQVAFQMVERSIEMDPGDPWAHYVLGSLIIFADPARAIKEFNTALELKPGWSRVQHNLAAAYLTSGKYREAEKLLLKILESSPDDVNALTNLGVTHLKMGKAQEAASDFRKALEKQPDFHIALKGLGDAAFAMKDYQTAIESYRKYMGLVPNDPTVPALLGMVYEAIKDKAAAREAYRKALDINPNDAEIRKRFEALSE